MNPKERIKLFEEGKALKEIDKKLPKGKHRWRSLKSDMNELWDAVILLRKELNKVETDNRQNKQRKISEDIARDFRSRLVALELANKLTSGVDGTPKRRQFRRVLRTEFQRYLEEEGIGQLYQVISKDKRFKKLKKRFEDLKDETI